MAAGLRASAYPNEELLDILRAFVGAKSTVLDIGAHIGTFSVPASRYVKEVIAFEPSAESFALLSKNSAQNSANVSLRNHALGAVPGTGALEVRAASNAGAHTLVQGSDFEVAALDHKDVQADFIKMDVEGMELQVLEGARKLIAASRPVVVFEVNLSQLRAHSASPRLLQHYFEGYGYRLYAPLRQAHTLVLGHVQNISVLTALLAPRAWFCYADSAPFDLVAVPQESPLPLPSTKFWPVCIYALRHNLAVKVARLRAWLS